VFSCYGMSIVFWDIVKFISTRHTSQYEIIQQEFGKLKTSVFRSADPFLFHIHEL
jgi:hypothetical protein